jgi:CDP-paratose 2-epimerase
MKLLITGICGFVGSTLAKSLLEQQAGLQITGIDNFIRPGSEMNRSPLKELGIKIHYGDIRNASDLESLPAVDFVVDAAANPSVLAGVDGKTSSLQLIEHNLSGTVHMLEHCKRHGAGFILLSTSRVYSIPPLASLPVEVHNNAYRPQFSSLSSQVSGFNSSGLSPLGVSENFSTEAPVSLYGCTKLASEALALEYGETFGFPVYINRCGVLAGAGQFGRADQGIFAYWINSHLRKKNLGYIGFDGLGHQVRDCLHPRDLAPLLLKQIGYSEKMSSSDRIINCSGGIESAMSLRQLTAWCDSRFGARPVAAKPENRPFDIPWIVLDSSKAQKKWNWSPSTPVNQILEEIAAHAEENPAWLSLSAPL